MKIANYNINKQTVFNKSNSKNKESNQAKPASENNSTAIPANLSKIYFGGVDLIQNKIDKALKNISDSHIIIFGNDYNDAKNVAKYLGYSLPKEEFIESNSKKSFILERENENYHLKALSDIKVNNYDLVAGRSIVLSGKEKVDIGNSSFLINLPTETTNQELEKRLKSFDDSNHNIKRMNKICEQFNDGNYIRKDIWAQYCPDIENYNNSNISGWKAHIYADTPEDWNNIQKTVIKYLKENNFLFKTVSSASNLKFLNTEEYNRNQWGKAFTVYTQEGNEEKLALAMKEIDNILFNKNLSKKGTLIKGDKAFGTSGRIFYRYQYDKNGDYKANSDNSFYKPSSIADIISDYTGEEVNSNFSQDLFNSDNSFYLPSSDKIDSIKNLKNGEKFILGKKTITGDSKIDALLKKSSIMDEHILITKKDNELYITNISKNDDVYLDEQKLLPDETRKLQYDGFFGTSELEFGLKGNTFLLDIKNPNKNQNQNDFFWD